jgi:hypothetical protein
MKKMLSISLLKKMAVMLVLPAILGACGLKSSPTQAQVMPSAVIEITATNPPAPTETLTPLMRSERTIQFSGYEWLVRDHGNNLSGPGPNLWDGSNVWVDENGDLHLKITHAEDGWHSAEVTMIQHLGFGKYQFQVISPIDQLDPNVVVGLFNYPTEAVGPDGTNEIDIEFAQWGNPAAPIGNFTVWPVKPGITNTSNSFPVELNGTYTTHRFIWESQQIFFQSLHGHTEDNENEFVNWLYQPDEPSAHISQQPMPIHVNLWLFQGQPPIDGNEAEVIIHNFSFTSME